MQAMFRVGSRAVITRTLTRQETPRQSGTILSGRAYAGDRDVGRVATTDCLL